MSKVVMILLCLFLPPIAVFLLEGVGLQLIINIILLVVSFGVLAIVHAFYLALSKHKAI